MLTPALIWPGFEAERKLPKGVRKRLARAARRDIRARDALGLAAAALGIEAPPAGALARLADGLSSEGGDWFRAEPVMLVPDRDSLVLLPLNEAPLGEEEAHALAGSARAHFGAALKLERGPSGRWYAAIEDVRDASAVSLAEVVGQPLDPASLAAGPDATRLCAFLTELQMLWHEHPVNRARREAGRPPANALWLWGGGQLPARPGIPVPVTLYGDAPELAGLAVWLEFEREPLAEPSSGQPHGETLVAIDTKDTALGEAWLGAFAGARGAWRLYVAGGEWRVPARSGFFRF